MKITEVELLANPSLINEHKVLEVMRDGKLVLTISSAVTKPMTNEELDALLAEIGADENTERGNWLE